MLVEAVFMLLAAKLAIRVLPAARLLSWAGREPRNQRRFANPELPALAAKVVTEAAPLRCIKAACLPQALSLQAMLRRRGIQSRLCLGVARNGQRLAAHAWVQIDRKVIIGETREAFAELAQFG